MKFEVKKTGVALVATFALAASLGLAACSGNGGTEQKEAEQPAAEQEADQEGQAEAAAPMDAAAPGEEAGFTEIPIFEDEMLGTFLHVNAVYFQPVPMTDGNGIEGYDLHLEADIAATEGGAKYGFETGSWVPYLTVDYKIIGSDGNTAAEGTFMEMSASDGPHYGANIALPNADTYTLQFTVHSPADNNYLLHTDAETGPGAQSFDEDFGMGPLVLTYEGWDYVPQEW